MRYLFILFFYSLTMPSILAQEIVEQQQFVIKRQRIIDNEKMFTEKEIQHLDRIIAHSWEKGIADIVIITIDDRHTDAENFDKYVIEHLTGHALGGDGKNNGVVIALSKKLRRMRIQNGYDTQRILRDEDTKKIIDEAFIPKFKEEKYFEGTMNGLNTIIGQIAKAIQDQDYVHASSIFSPSIFKKIRKFVLENGEPQTFRDLDEGNPSYNFTTLDVFFGPSRKHAFVRKDFRDNDYYEMTIRNNDGHQYQFVYYEQPIPEQTFIHPEMQVNSVYWWHPQDKFLSSDVWPLLAQIEDEIAQSTAVHEAKSFAEYQWVLKQEFHPMERTYKDIEHPDTLSFHGNHFAVNGEGAGTFYLNPEARTISLQTIEGKQPTFAIFKMDNSYNYRYTFHKKNQTLYLVPLDEKEGNELLCVEGCTLLFEIVENDK